MKLIERNQYLDKMLGVIGMPDIKVFARNRDVRYLYFLKEMQCGTIDLNIAPNETLIFNLQIQSDVLKAKLAKMAVEEIK